MRCVGGSVAPDGEEDLLKQIFGYRVVAYHAVRQRVELAAIALVEYAYSPICADSQGVYQHLVARFITLSLWRRGRLWPGIDNQTRSRRDERSLVVHSAPNIRYAGSLYNEPLKMREIDYPTEISIGRKRRLSQELCG